MVTCREVEYMDTDTGWVEDLGLRVCGSSLPIASNFFSSELEKKMLLGEGAERGAGLGDLKKEKV